MAEDVLISDSFPRTKKRMKPGKARAIKEIEEIPLTTQNEDMHTKTKARFDQLLKQAVDQGNISEPKPRKKKKKPKKGDDEDVLEKLKKGEGLVKDEDAAIIANTYVPGDSPKNTKTNRNQEGTDNFGYEDETSLTIPSNKSTKKRKKKDTNLTTSNSLLSEEGTDRAKETDLGDPEHQKSKSKLPPLMTSDSKEKKFKKKKTTKTSVDLEAGETSTSPLISPRDGQINNKITTNSDVEKGNDSGELSQKAVTRKKKKAKNVSNSTDVTEASEAEKVENVPKKKKKKKVAKFDEQSNDQLVESPRSELSATGEDEQTAEIVDEVSPVKTKRKKKKVKEPTTASTEGEITETVKDDGRILAITVHRTDKLKNDFYIMHPVVRVHIVNEATGQYLNKQDSKRPVTSFYENEQDTIGHIQAIITQPFDFKQKRSILPMWEEILIFNENFNYFIQQDPKVIIFFEVLDFVSMNTASRQYSEAKEQGGWHRIAWAFLKLVGSNERLNTGSKVRLQLYHPPERFLLDEGHIELFQWWETAARRPYPSTLYVTLKGIITPSKVEPSTRSLYATQEEVGRMTYEDLKKTGTLNSKTRGEGQHKKYLTTWNRLAGQSCKVPNNLFLSLYAGKKGCFVLKFSHDGRSLACACHDKDGYPIYIYEIPSGELLGKLSGHFGIVYDLCWCKNDTQLLSASSDGTARVWDMSQMKEPKEQLLPHPAFVYTAQFHPNVDTVIATGGYDQVIRVWQMAPDQQPELLQEIEGHHGNVNSLCFDEDGSKLYSADSLGDIKIWNVYVTDDVSRKGFIRDWGLYQDVQEPELVGVPINYLRIHPSGRRLLVHSRDNIIRMLDLRILRVMQKYIGALNFREELHSTFSPCGTFVFAGSEDGSAYVWNTETGDQVACYSELNYQQPVTSLDYHPRDHMVAFCSLGENQAVFIYKYNPQVAALDAGIPVKPKEDVDKLKNTNKLGDVYTKDEFEASETVRLEKVMKKLSSVTMSTRPMIPAESHPLGLHDPSPRTTRTGLLGSSSWGYDQSSAYLTPRSQSPPPPLFSPHAPSTLSTSMQQQQMTSHSMYLKQSEGSWRPEFSSVGRHGARPSSPTFWGKAPNISLNASQSGKAQFSFQPPVGKAPKLRKVVALYEYRGQRSDELNFLKGEVIKVLYKDNENWWMGELKGGQQGFFPANYVTEEEPSEDDMEDDNQEEEMKEEEKREKKKVTAYKSKTGELRFLSATEDSEDDGQLTKKPRSRRRKNGTDSTSPRSRKPPESTVKGRPLKDADESYA